MLAASLMLHWKCSLWSRLELNLDHTFSAVIFTTTSTTFARSCSAFVCPALASMVVLLHNSFGRSPLQRYCTTRKPHSSRLNRTFSSFNGSLHQCLATFTSYMDFPLNDDCAVTYPKGRHLPLIELKGNPPAVRIDCITNQEVCEKLSAVYVGAELVSRLTFSSASTDLTLSVKQVIRFFPKTSPMFPSS